MLQCLARKWFKALGWTTVNAPQPKPHGIMVVYPHTSNWDFLMGVLWKYACDRQPRWVAKDSIFIPPFGWFLRKMGGMGIKRDGNLDISTVLKNTMLKKDTCWLGMAIEGARRHKDYVHMSYYHIARAADLPIGIALIDYTHKIVGVREYRQPMPTIEQELAQLAMDYAGVGAKYPEKVGTLKLRDKTA